MSEPRTTTPSRARLARAGLVALLLLLTVGGYARVLHGQFQFDDRAIESIPAVKAGLPGLKLIAFSVPASRPVLVATFVLSQAIGRWDPFTFHATNLAIHLAAMLLLWRLALVVLKRAELPGAEWVALAAAGLFALHPLNTQAVSYVVQRGESLSTLFAVATILFLLAAEGTGRRSAQVALATCGLVAFAVGVGAKPTAILAPFLWLLAAAAFPARPTEPLPTRVRRWLVIGAPFLAGGVLAAIGLLTHLSGRHDAGFSVPGSDAWRYLLTQSRATLLYARLLAWPAGQSIEHDLPLADGVDAAAAAIGLCYGAVLLASARMLSRPPQGWGGPARAAGRVAAFGVLWWFACLAPSSSFIPVVDPVMEHRAYMAAFGPLLAVAAVGSVLLRRLAPPWSARVALAALLLCWGSLAWALHARNAVWETEVALWQDAVAKAPRKTRAAANLGFALQQAGRLEEALTAYRRALALPWDAGVRSVELKDHLGTTLVKLGRPAEAVPVLVSALEEDPESVGTANTLAIALLELGRPAEAERLARAAIELQPAFGHAFSTLGECLEAQGKLEEALAAYQRSAAIDPDVGVRHLNVARVAERLGRATVACQALAALRDARGARADAEALRARLRCAGP